MFSIFKSDPTKKLRKKHDLKLEQAMHAQRNGDIRAYAQLSFEAEEINKQILQIESESKS